MRAHIPGRYAALALMLGGLACAGNKAETDDGTVVAQDTTQAADTSAYKGMERDTTMAPVDTTQAAPAPAPTPADTTSYQPAPAPEPTQTPTDTSSYAPPSTPTDTGATAAPTAPAPGADSTSGWSDTTKAQ